MCVIMTTQEESEVWWCHFPLPLLSAVFLEPESHGLVFDNKRSSSSWRIHWQLMADRTEIDIFFSGTATAKVWCSLPRQPVEGRDYLGL